MMKFYGVGRLRQLCYVLKITVPDFVEWNWCTLIKLSHVRLGVLRRRWHEKRVAGISLRKTSGYSPSRERCHSTNLPRSLNDQRKWKKRNFASCSRPPFLSFIDFPPENLQIKFSYKKQRAKANRVISLWSFTIKTRRSLIVWLILTAYFTPRGLRIAFIVCSHFGSCFLIVFFAYGPIKYEQFLKRFIWRIDGILIGTPTQASVDLGVMAMKGWLHTSLTLRIGA